MRLARMLEAGEDAGQVLEYLRLAPELVASGVERADMHGPELFTPGAWPRYCRSARTHLLEIARRDAVAAQVEREGAIAAERHQKAAEEATAAAAQRAQNARNADALQAEALAAISNGEKGGTPFAGVLPDVHAMRFMGRDRQAEHDEAAEIEARRALNRYLSDLRTAADRPLTPAEAAEARRRFAELHRPAGASQTV
jgi:hypothetical protein